MDGWQDLELRQLCTLRAGSVFKREFQGRTEGEYPFIKVSDMKLDQNEICVRAANNWLDAATCMKLKAKPFPAGTTVFAKIGEALKKNRVRYLVQDTLADNNMMGAIPRRSVVLPRYLLYLLSHAKLSSMAIGTALPYLTVRALGSLRLHVPPCAVQRRIAAVLSAYDDLIENSLRRIEILEELARSFFDEWFIRFRFPGHENARFVDSPLGRIPEGWRVDKLARIATIQTGRSNRQDAVPDGAFALFDRSPEIKRSHRFLLDGEAVIVPGEGREFRPRYWSTGPFDLHQRVYALTDFRGVDGIFVYFTLLDRMVYFSQVATGATVKSLRKGMFERFALAIPPALLMTEFVNHARSALGLIDTLRERNAALRQARDLLLPKLIAGVLDVSDLPVRPRPLYLGDPHRITGYGFFRDIAALPFVEKIALFGSRARDDHEERSDIDLCVFCGDAGEDEWSEVLACLERDRVDTLLKVDCARFETSSAALRENVLTEGIVLFERREGP